MTSSPTAKQSRGQLGKWTYWAASTQPLALDIVWCHFPDRISKELKPRPGAHPGLIRRVVRTSDGELAVQVAFGTSNLKADREIPHQLVISHRRDLDEAGLMKPTRFDLAQTKYLPWCREFFAELRPGNGPVI